MTSQNKLENALRNAEWAYETVVKCHSIIVNADNEDDLFNAICNILVTEGPFKLAWVGRADQGEDKKVVPVAEAGFKKGYLSSIDISWGENKLGQGPTGKAIRSGLPQAILDIQNDPAFAPWRDKALEYNYHSSIALPIICDNKRVLGALNIYSENPNNFDGKQIDLLVNLSLDLARGVNILRIKDEKEKAELALHETLFNTVKVLALALEKRDPYTSGHQKRVADLAVAIASKMGLDEFTIEGIRLGGIIHDIGKIYVPADILNRPGKLTDAEFEIIKSHPQVGLEIMCDIDFLWPIKEIIIQHHERLDGTGYPKGLKENEIVLEAKIIAVADVVEAINSHRPYRPAYGIEVALDELKRGKGTSYDPQISDLCIELFSKDGFQWA